MAAGSPSTGTGTAPGAAAAVAAGTQQQSLHDEIASFVAAVTETPQEHVNKTTAVRKVQTAARAAGLVTSAQVQVQPFGSFVNGLGMHSSDLDLVVTGLLAPDHPQNGGYNDKTKVRVNRLLGQVRGALFRAGDLETCEQIRRARVPILKCVLKGGQQVDVSISNGDGPAAAQYIRDKVAEHPALRPLVLVLKCILGDAGLNDASKGGLSSFALANMALASLQEDAKAGRSGADFGAALNSFLLRFGTTFKVYTQGVAVGRGGIVQKEQVPAMAEVLANPIRKDGTDALQRLCLEDPQTGREVAGGTGKVKQVLTAFRDAGAKLHQAQFLGRPGGCLQALFDVYAAARRAHIKAPQQAPKHAAAKLQAAQPAAASMPAGKRKRQTDSPAASPHPATKRHAAQQSSAAASSGLAGGGDSAQQTRGPAAQRGAGGAAIAAAGLGGSRQAARPGHGAGPLPSPAGRPGAGAALFGGRNGGGAARGGGGGRHSRFPATDQQFGRQQLQQQQRVPPPGAPGNLPAGPDQRSWEGHPAASSLPAQMPISPQAAAPDGWQGPAARHAGLGTDFGHGQGHLQSPQQQHQPRFGTAPHSRSWLPRPQGQHIRFPDDDWVPPQQQHQQHQHHRLQVGLQQEAPWQPPPPPQQQQQRSATMQLQQQHVHMQHGQPQQTPPSWQHQPQQQPEWQLPQDGMGPDWQPPAQLSGGGHGWQGGATSHEFPGMRSPRWR